MMLKTYIWTKEDLCKYALQILEQGWPFEPMRLLGIRMSSLKSVTEVKKDSSLNQFFKQKLSTEEFMNQNEKNLKMAKNESKMLQVTKSAKV